MKVLIFSLAYPPFIGGAELAVKEITDRLSGVEFHMITTNLDGKQKEVETMGNVTVHRVGGGRLSKYIFPFAALKKAKELNSVNKYSLSWAIMANQAGLAALWFKQAQPQIPYLLTLQEGDSLTKIWSRTWFMRAKYKDIYRKADHIQAISRYLQNRALNYGYNGPISIVANGVDYKHFAQKISEESKIAVRNSLGLTEEDTVVVTASRLVEKNGVDLLIKSMQDLDARLVIIGKGGLEADLKALAGELGLRDKVVFVGHKSHKELPKYLQMADIFARPSRSEGLGSAFLEAMAAGIPVIATPVGGIPDFVIDGQTGVFCEPNNPRDIKEKIRQLSSDKEMYQRVVTNGKKLVYDKYQWEHVTQEMEQIFSTMKV